jgi:AraC-like DNA-binding protein
MGERIRGALLELLPAGEASMSALARHYPTGSSMSAAEISFLLGYQDANLFYRAFHAWTGRAPDRVRAAAMRGE